MKIDSFSTIGTFHSQHNEDFVVVAEAGNGRQLIAVMDGCSMGRESHFAAALMGKLLRYIAKNIHYKEFAIKQQENLDVLLKHTLLELFNRLKILKNNIGLEWDELLCTLILAIVDKHGEAEIMVVGDGIVQYDGVLKEYDHDNRPDYLAYHLHLDFEEWYFAQTQHLNLKGSQEIILISDGLFSFQKFNNKNYEDIKEQDIVQFLLFDKEKTLTIRQKIRLLEQQWGLKPTDDFSMVKVVF